ncbi:MAG: hypothetical protein HQK55_07870, partial [Deltaproteobacteria bacterium]|nr:hypothetical protein [Deltaproteobacteria bacterium]
MADEARGKRGEARGNTESQISEQMREWILRMLHEEDSPYKYKHIQIQEWLSGDEIIQASLNHMLAGNQINAISTAMGFTDEPGMFANLGISSYGDGPTYADYPLESYIHLTQQLEGMDYSFAPNLEGAQVLYLGLGAWTGRIRR